ncbi:MAG: hypothetical protein A2252_11780 [Elusimicrobia bacterium RIFOXYA2_FULL_39_19]|nr:MAG: hypothetical protein A2252_11780 [Elusimicrobia bacterium RIFOXYA2_FULL_39_19]
MKKITILFSITFLLVSFAQARMRNPLTGGTFSESKHLMLEYSNGVVVDIYKYPTPNTSLEDWEVEANEKSRSTLEDIAVGYKYENIFPDAFPNFSAVFFLQNENNKALDASWLEGLINYKTDGFGYTLIKRYSGDENIRLTIQGEHKNYNSLKRSSSTTPGPVTGYIAHYDGFYFDINSSYEFNEALELNEYKRFYTYFYNYNYNGTSDYSDYCYVNSAGEWRRSVNSKVSLGFNVQITNRFGLNKGITQNQENNIRANDYQTMLFYPRVNYQLRENVAISFEPRYETYNRKNVFYSYNATGARFYMGTELEVRDRPVYDFGISIQQMIRNYPNSDELTRSIMSINPDLTYNFMKHFQVTFDMSYNMEDSSNNYRDNTNYYYGFRFTAWL